MSNSEDRNKHADVTRDSIAVRPLEHGDPAKIMNIDFSLEGVTIYTWRDGNLVKGTEYEDGEDLSPDEKKSRIQPVENGVGKPGAIEVGAFKDDSLVGYICIALLSHEDGMWKLWQTIVSKDYRRNGIATSMFQFAKKEAIKRGGKAICLLSAVNHSAVDFYRSVGFTPFEKPPEDEHWSYWDGEDIYMEMKL